MKILSIVPRIFLLFSFFLLASCDYQILWKDAPYKVLTIDNSGQSLVYDLGNDASIGRVGPEVVAVGSNRAFVVVAQLHDHDRFYFYIDRSKDGPYRDNDYAVVGPLTKIEFDRVKAKLNLPSFTQRFKEIRRSSERD